jgi:hypothetical protein
MIKEAEENSFTDKSKKILTTLFYEFDNLFFKYENLKKINLKYDLLLQNYFDLIISELKLLNLDNDFKSVIKILELLKTSKNLILINLLEQKLVKE